MESIVNSSSPAQSAEASLSVVRCGTHASRLAPAENYVGTVRVDPLFPVVAPARAGATLVTFEPGARTAWHPHPLGQRLIVTAGCGCVQQWDQPMTEIRPGDVVVIPPHVKHWHGATKTTGMSHIAIHEYLDGHVVDWAEHVTDDV